MDDILRYFAVIPNGRWVGTESANRRGYPAVHAIKPEHSFTLCWRWADRPGAAWDWYVDDETMPAVNCKLCLKQIAKAQEAGDG